MDCGLVTLLGRELLIVDTIYESKLGQVEVEGGSLVMLMFNDDNVLLTGPVGAN